MKCFISLAFLLTLCAGMNLPDNQLSAVPPVPEHDDAVTPLNHIVPELPAEGFLSRNPIHTEDGQELFEGDIKLTSEQRAALDDRKLLGSDSSLWTSPIKYVITSSSAGDAAAIRNAVQYWQDRVCLTFTEVSSTTGPHMQFIKSSGCWSYVGVISSSGQQISIGSGCASLGVIVHEIGHALGFYHEQSRPDRDTYVTVNFGNIQSGKEGNFNMATSARNFSVPYDLTSVMHYGAYDFSSNGKATIQVKNVFHEGLIGNRAGLSHRDMALANLGYKCADQCSSKPTCLNGGFITANCSCICPQGTSGSGCETVTGDYYGELSCGGQFSLAAGASMTINSPNYPNNYPTFARCIWYFTAPADATLQISVTDMKMLYRSNGVCPWDYIALRTTSDMTNDNIIACDEELKGETRSSTTNEMVVRFKTNNYPWYRGFQAIVSVIGGSTETTTQSTTTQSTTTPSTTIQSTTTPSTTTQSTTTQSTTTAQTTVTAETTTAVTGTSPDC